MDWPNTDCARGSYILRSLATSARKLALEQMRAPEPLGRARRVHVLTRDAHEVRFAVVASVAHEVRFAVVASVALERSQLGADLDRRPDGARSPQAVDIKGRAGIGRGRISGTTTSSWSPRRSKGSMCGARWRRVRRVDIAKELDVGARFGRGLGAKRKYLREEY